MSQDNDKHIYEGDNTAFKEADPSNSGQVVKAASTWNGQGKVFQHEDQHMYVYENEVTFQRRQAPKETIPNNTEHLVKATSTSNDQDIGKINSKNKVLFSMAVLLFMAILAVFGMVVSGSSRSNIQYNELKQSLAEQTRTLERNLIKSISELRNESRNDTRISERDLIAMIKDATSSLNQTGYKMMFIVEDYKRDIDMLSRVRNDRNVTDCSKVDPSSYKSGNRSRGVFDISVSGQHIDAFCDLSTDSGNWTVIQRRMDGSVDFFRKYAEYVVGFGRTVGEYWIGLQNLYNILQSSENFELRIDMEDWNGVRKFAKYSRFDVDSPSNDYTLSVSGYSGTAGDSLSIHNGMRFTTKDHDVDTHSTINCATFGKGAWWYKDCHSSNLNSFYHKGGAHDSYADGINWRTWTTYHYSLKFVEMKIKPTL